MKKLFFFIVAAMICATSMSAQSKIKKTKAIEGGKVAQTTLKLTGIEMSEKMSDDGMSIEKVAYRWFAGIGQADDKQMAIEIAQREAYATISRMIENSVSDKAERGGLANDGKVKKALTSHWAQISNSLQRGCEPFGDVLLDYNKKTSMYEATAKVAIRGDKFAALMNQAAQTKPEGLSDKELEEFIEYNQSIINIAKGQ